MNMKKLASVLAIFYGTGGYLLYQGSLGNDDLGMWGIMMVPVMFYVTMGLLVGFAGTFVYKFGQWLMS